MAIAYASSSTTNNFASATTTAVVTKPSGLAVGDLMIGQCVAVVDNVSDITLPSGWTQLTSLDSGSVCTNIGYKIADSGDAAATNFTFTISGSFLNGASIVRVTGAGTVPNFVTGTFSTTSTQSTHTYTNGITPNFANSLLLFMNYFNDQGGGDTNTGSGYAIVTSNPSWTEAYDFGANNVPGLTMQLAYANRPEVTSTGNFSVSSSPNNCDGRAVLVAIAPQLDATITPTVISLTLSVQSPDVGVTALPTVMSVVLTVQAPTITVTANPFTNQSKNTINPTNQSKNNINPTNQAKNTSTWTNQAKS